MKEEMKLAEMSQEELDIRNELEAEIWSEGGTPHEEKTPSAEPAPEEGGGDKVAEPDPWQDVNPIVKKALEELDAKFQSVERLDQRLKQAENRVGSIDNRLRDMRDLAANRKPPTQEEIKKALESNQGWKNFVDDFPAHAEALTLAMTLGGGHSGNPLEEIATVRQQLETNFEERLTKSQLAFELKLLKMKHPNHLAIVNEPEFLPWLQTQDEETQKKYGSWDALDGISLIDSYLATKAKKTEPPPREPLPDIIAQRNKRANQHASAPPQGPKTMKPKSEAEMTEAELREHLAKEIWGPSQ
jgi:hypothetical protein